jgi:uncharacterized membrane protein
MKRDRRLLGVAVCAGLLLRCLFIGSRSIQYDDAFSILLSERGLSEIVSGTAADTMPPLYYFMLHFWMQVSRSLTWLRLLSVLLSMGSLVLLYLLVSRVSTPDAGAWAALLAAISPLQIYHAQDIRMYALLALTELGYLFFFVRIWQDDAVPIRPKKWIGLILYGTAAMYTHNLAIFVLVAPLILLAIQRKWRLLVRMGLALGGIGLLALPWLLLVPGQVQKIQHAFWTPRPGIADIINTLMMFTATLPLPGYWLIAALVLCVWIVAVMGLETWRRRRDPDGEPVLFFLTMIPPALLFLVSYLMRPVFVPRGFLVSGLMFLGWAGILIHRSWSTTGGIVLAAAFVISAAIGIPYQQTYRDFPRSPFRETTVYLSNQVVRQSAGESTPFILHDNKLSYFPCLYFDPELRQAFLPDEAGSQNDTLAPATQDALNIHPEQDLASAVESEKDVYFVVFQKTIDEYKQTGEQNHPVLTWLGEHFQYIGVQTFHDLDVYHFLR